MVTDSEKLYNVGRIYYGWVLYSKETKQKDPDCVDYEMEPHTLKAIERLMEIEGMMQIPVSSNTLREHHFFGNHQGEIYLIPDPTKLVNENYAKYRPDAYYFYPDDLLMGPDEPFLAAEEPS
ncbi:MAG: hypothetical protein LIP09_00475 [Bacteroidales bacterium]|nr:hypothetical protein [Bacteroidales bacterium]